MNRASFWIHALLVTLGCNSGTVDDKDLDATSAPRPTEAKMARRMAAMVAASGTG